MLGYPYCLAYPYCPDCPYCLDYLYCLDYPYYQDCPYRLDYPSYLDYHPDFLHQDFQDLVYQHFHLELRLGCHLLHLVLRHLGCHFHHLEYFNRAMHKFTMVCI